MEYTKDKFERFENRLSLFWFTWDFCMPAVCSVDDLELIVSSVTTHLNTKYALQFSEDLCHYKSKPNVYKIEDYFAM